jgi:hypothetical protein
MSGEKQPIHEGCGNCTDCDSNKNIYFYHCRKGGTYNKSGTIRVDDTVVVSEDPERKGYVAIGVDCRTTEECEKSKSGVDYSLIFLRCMVISIISGLITLFGLNNQILAVIVSIVVAIICYFISTEKK